MADWIREWPEAPGLQRIEARFDGHAYDPHRHEALALGVTESGVQSFRYRGARVDSRAGDTLVIYPDELHDGFAGAAGGFDYRMVYVAPRLLRDALGGASLPGPAAHPRRVPGLAAAVRAAFFSATLDPLEREEAAALLAGALVPDAGPRLRTAAATEDAVERARRHLDGGFAEPMTGADLEAAVGLDRFALIRQFARRFGTTPHRYLVARRLEGALRMMRRGESLVDCATGNGFADQSHLSRCFRAAYGLPPGRWRALASAASGLPTARC